MEGLKYLTLKRMSPRPARGFFSRLILTFIRKSKSLNMFAKNCHSTTNGKSLFASFTMIALVLVTFLLSGISNSLTGQEVVQKFDPESVLPAKLVEIQKTTDDQVISLSDSEKKYIDLQLNKIRARKKIVKRELKKAEALNYLDAAKALKDELDELVAMTTNYYKVIYKANKEN